MSAVLNALGRYGDQVALESQGRTLSYRQLHAHAVSLADTLRSERAVAMLMQNGIAWIITDLACIMANVPCVPLPPFFTAEQCVHAMRDAGVSLLITENPGRFGASGQTIDIAGFDACLMKQAYAPVTLPPHTAKITYTSGTTGNPKGVCLTQYAMETVAASLLQALGPDIAQRHVCLLPLAILLENVAGVYTSLMAGATCILPVVKHEPQALAAAINDAQATSCILVPELLRMLIASGVSMPGLRFAAVGGAKLALSLLKAAHAKGIPAYEGYGISENASVITLNSPAVHKHGTAGQVLPHIELRIAKDGEILVRNPLFSGYIRHAPSQEEWYATGDLGEMDEQGFLRIYGRKRNVFITSFGRNVSPEWPESLLVAQPVIMQAAVFGEALPRPIAIIVSHSPQQVPGAIERANAALPDYARIHAFVMADAPFLPQNGQLTGNGRMKREAIFAAYRSRIETSAQLPMETAL